MTKLRLKVQNLSDMLEKDSPFDERIDDNLPDDIEFSSPTDTERIQHTYLTGEDYHFSHERNYEGPTNMPLPRRLSY